MRGTKAKQIRLWMNLQVEEGSEILDMVNVRCNWLANRFDSHINPMRQLKKAYERPQNFDFRDSPCPL